MTALKLPYQCQPSRAVSRDQTRPMLCHAHLRRRGGDLWLEVTDSYIAVALRCEGDAQEGWVPLQVLQLLEREAKAKHARKTFVQDSDRAWTVVDPTGDCEVTTTYVVRDMVANGTWPNFESLGVYDDPKPADEVSPFGFNPELLANVGAALGGTLRVDFQGPLKPIALRTQGGEGRGLQMPIRLIEDEPARSPRRSSGAARVKAAA